VRWTGISMIFQAAMNALNPVYRVGDQIVEAMQTHFENITIAESKKRIAELFDLVGLDPALMDRYPHEFSGGMRQRAIIAMALSCDPSVIIADEPTTALDVIVQDRILKELRSIQDKLNMGMIYISHDIAVIAEVSDRMGVMYAGRMVELADVVDVFERPIHPYTFALMSAFPSIKGAKRELTTLPGEPPDLLNPPPGCRFHPRCPRATSECKEAVPPFEDKGAGHFTACWHPVDVHPKEVD
jgi:peptide/nickel transport system ATP-binding protein